MNTTTSPLLFSLKPCYANLIFAGLKGAELRRRVTPYMENRDVFIYVSSPVRQLGGGFRVGQVWSGPLEEVWNEVSERVGIDKRIFDAYYAGRTVAYALEITNVWKCKNPVGLNELRNQFPNFVAPQSWRYVKPEEHPKFHSMINGITKYETGVRLNQPGFRLSRHGCV